MLTILGPSPMALFTAEAESIGRERLEVRPSHLLSSSVSTLTICIPINAYLCQSYINPCHCIYQSSPCSRVLRSQTSRRCSQDEPQPSSGFSILWLLPFSHIWYQISFKMISNQYLPWYRIQPFSQDDSCKEDQHKSVPPGAQTMKSINLWIQFAITPRQH